MLFSIQYRIDSRYEYFNRFMRKLQKSLSVSEVEVTRDKYEDLMEIIVKFIIDKNKQGLLMLLTKTNGKSARMFFNYLTCSNIKNVNKETISKRINEIFKDPFDSFNSIN